MVWLILSLLLSIAVISMLLLVSYKGDFYEQALEDGLSISKKKNEAKAGKRASIEDLKVRNKASTTFKDGAYAIFSMNILVMKKTGQWITKNDLII